MVKIQLIKVGDTYPLECEKLERIGARSSIWTVHSTCDVFNPDILNQHDTGWLSDADFLSLAKGPNGADLSVAIVNMGLENNYFSRPITEKLIVISIADIETLNMHEGISVEMFLARFLYAFATMFRACNDRLPTYQQVEELMGKNPQGCLFDMCRTKPRIAMFFRQPYLSPEACVFLRKHSLPEDFISSLQNEIKGLRIGQYYRIKDWLKAHPIAAMVFAFLGATLSGILGNYVYGIICHTLPFAGR